MLRKLVFLLVCFLGLWSLGYGQSYTSAKLKTLGFINSIDNTVVFAPSAEAYMAMDISPKFFGYGVFEYHKYFYLPPDYPARRGGFLIGLGFQNKNFSTRLGLGTGENFDYLWEVAIRFGKNIDRKKYVWIGEVYLRHGQNNVLKSGEILASANLAYKFYDLLELGIVYHGKKIQPISSSHWWGPKIRSEIADNWYITGELHKWQKNIFGVAGLQIILL